MSAYIGLTGKELARKRLLLVAVLVTVLFLAFYCYGLTKTAEASDFASASLIERYATVMPVLLIGLFFAQMLTAFFVLFASIGSISAEIESGQMLAVLSRPIPRWQVYLGKWLGFGVWNLLYSACLFWAIILANHYIFDFPLHAATLTKAFLLFEWVPLLLGTVSLLGSSYLPIIGNGILCALLYGMSMFAGFLEAVTGTKVYNTGMEKFSLFTSLIMPSDAVFRRMVFELFGGSSLPIVGSMDQLGPFSPSALPNNTYLVYTVFFLLAGLTWGCMRFTKRDLS